MPEQKIIITQTDTEVRVEAPGLNKIQAFLAVATAFNMMREELFKEAEQNPVTAMQELLTERERCESTSH